MNEPKECTDMTARFFQALQVLKETKKIRGLQTFTKRYNENYWNASTLKKKGLRIKQEWLTYLVRDYNVSAEWLLTGNGTIFKS